MMQPPRCKKLVLDAGPLLSLSPLRGLAETYLTVPQVLAELKDKRAREHFERLGLISGVKIEVKAPSAASLAHVIQWAKKTGDYSVLSYPDLCVLALAYSLDEEEKALKGQNGSPVTTESIVEPTATMESISQKLEEATFEDLRDGSDNDMPADGRAVSIKAEDEQSLEPLDVEVQPLRDDNNTSPSPDKQNLASPVATTPNPASSPIYDDPSDSDDGEGEWITPSNVALHKSRALDLLPEAGAKGKREVEEIIGAGCMTADFAMQNVLLQMGLSLVGVEGKKIEKVKSWVLRCHACFKICKDSSKKFCPSCGNATLLRASVTITTPNASPNAPTMQVHLKPNFQYKTRGTKYSIPLPKAGSAKKGPSTGLILREDQMEYMRAKKQADGKREREEARMTRGILGRGAEGNIGVHGVGSWMDPDWVPEMLTVGAGGKGRTMRSSGMDGDMPVIGHGRKNPNERKRKK